MDRPTPRRGPALTPSAPRFAALAALALAALPFAAEPAQAQERAARADQIFVTRNSGTVVRSGIVKQNGLAEVVVEEDGRERKYPTAEVERIVFGDVPRSFKDGDAYFDRSDFANAAASFRIAATDAGTRDVVQALARLRAAEALMKGGASDQNLFAEARDELDRFLSDHPSNRDVPEARYLRARAMHLAGDASAAAQEYLALFGEEKDGKPTTGYDLVLCYRAGLRGAQAHLDAGETDAARTAYTQLRSAVMNAAGSVDPADPRKHELDQLAARARLGEGFCMLASGSAAQAKTFFERSLTSGSGEDVNGARLGKAAALLAEGAVREAQLEFATVSALDHTDRDRVARAMVGLAECTLRLGDKNAKESARALLEAVVARYGDTPALAGAQEKLATL